MDTPAPTKQQGSSTTLNNAQGQCHPCVQCDSYQIPFNGCRKTFGGLGENHMDAELSQLVATNFPLVGHAYQVLHVKQEVNLLISFTST